jgi:hypothetical protein
MNGFTLELQSIGYKSQKFGVFFFGLCRWKQLDFDVYIIGLRLELSENDSQDN